MSHQKDCHVLDSVPWLLVITGGFPMVIIWRISVGLVKTLAAFLAVFHGNNTELICVVKMVGQYACPNLKNEAFENISGRRSRKFGMLDHSHVPVPATTWCRGSQEQATMNWKVGSCRHVSRGTVPERFGTDRISVARRQFTLDRARA